MSPRTEKQFKEIRETKKELILNTALEEFAEHGYHATSISKISNKANISKGLIYNYFESKEDVLKSIINKGLSVMTEAYNPNKFEEITEDVFEFIVEQTFLVLKKNRHFWKLYFSIIMKSGVSEIIKDPIKKYFEPFIFKMLEYYKKQGKENPMANALLFGAMLDGISINYILHPEMYPLEDIKKLLIQKFK